MSKNWVQDIAEMQGKYHTRKWVSENPDKLKCFLKFRLEFLNEELGETWKAFEEKDSDELVDGLIDLAVIAIGTLDAFDIDAYKAWDAVLKANLAKEIGEKPSRPNPLGVPDLVKPEDWKGPSHLDNVGLFDKAFNNSSQMDLF